MCRMKLEIEAYRHIHGDRKVYFVIAGRIKQPVVLIALANGVNMCHIFTMKNISRAVADDIVQKVIDTVPNVCEAVQVSEWE